jgi:hypothetical protein
MAELHWFPAFSRNFLRREAVPRRPASGRAAVMSVEVSAQRWIIDLAGLKPRRKSELWESIVAAMEDGDIPYLAQFRFLRKPTVVRFGRVPIPIEMRRRVYERDGGKCRRCSDGKNLQFDHVTPVVHGGETTVANLQLLCRDCNKQKGPRSWERRRMPKAKHG